MDINARYASRYLLLLVIPILGIAFWPGMRDWDAFRGPRIMALLSLPGFWVSWRLCKLNIGLGLAMAWAIAASTLLIIFQSSRLHFLPTSFSLFVLIACGMIVLWASHISYLKELKWAIAIVVLLNLAMAFLQWQGIYLWLTPKQIDFPMIGFMGNQPNLAHLLSLSIPTLFSLHWVLAIPVLFLLVLTRTSFAILAAIIAMLFLLKTKWIKFGLLVALIGSIWIVDKPNMQDMVRFKVWKETIQLSFGFLPERYKEYKIKIGMTGYKKALIPVFGWGAGSFKNTYPMLSLQTIKASGNPTKNITFGEIWWHPVNEFLKVAFEVGWPAFAFLIFGIAAAGKKFFRTRQRMKGFAGEHRWAAASLVAVIVSSFGYQPLSMPFLLLLSCILVGAGLARL